MVCSNGPMFLRRLVFSLLLCLQRSICSCAGCSLCSCAKNGLSAPVQECSLCSCAHDVLSAPAHTISSLLLLTQCSLCSCALNGRTAPLFWTPDFTAPSHISLFQCAVRLFKRMESMDVLRAFVFVLCASAPLPTALSATSNSDAQLWFLRLRNTCSEAEFMNFNFIEVSGQWA